MTDFEIGDIVRVPFPFVEQDRVQARPVLIVSRPQGPDGALFWSLMITSARRSSWPGDVAIAPDCPDTGLAVPCFVRTAKIATLDRGTIERRLGRLPPALLAAVRGHLRTALPWL